MFRHQSRHAPPAVARKTIQSRHVRRPAYLWEILEDRWVLSPAAEPAISGTMVRLTPINEGTASASVEVATFTHESGVEPTADFTATVDWGIAGHNADPATVHQMSSGSDYTVSATRPVFAEQGNYTVKVMISEDGASTTVTDSQEVDEGNLEGTATYPTIHEDDPAAPLLVATFTHNTGLQPATDFSATIDWGIAGHHSDTGMVTAANGGYDVTGTHHVFTDGGNYQYFVTFTEIGPASFLRAHFFTAHGILHVEDEPIDGTSATLAPVAEGDPSASVEVATFTHDNASEPTSDFTATIDWGIAGHHSDPGVVTLDGTTYHVSATRPVFSEDTSTSNNVTVTIYETLEGGSAYTAFKDTQGVTEPAINATSATLTPVAEDDASASVEVATFTHANGVEPATDFTATVDWGIAGHHSDPAVVTLDGTTYDVSATRPVFSEETSTSNNVTVSISEDGSTTPTTVTDTQGVTDPPVQASGVPVYAVEATPLSGVTVATFTDPGGAEPNPSDPTGGISDHYTVDSIDWGDSTPLDTSSGAISYSGAQGSTTDLFTVTGSHTYTEEGSHTITAIVDHEGVRTTVMTTAVVKDKLGLLLLDPAGSQSLAVTGDGNVTVTGGSGAAVVDSSASHAATVTGNGVVSAGDFDVTGGVVTTGHGVVPSPVDHEIPTPDPLGLGLPSPLPPPPVGNTATLLHPGTYVGGLQISGKSAVTLSPGIYVMEGGGFAVDGQGSVTGSGVVIINIPGGPGDAISVSGNAVLSLSAPTSGPYQGVAVVQVDATPVAFSGQASVAIAGVFYTPSTRVSVTGNAVVTVNPGPGTATNPAISAALIAFDLSVTGNGAVTINPDGPPAAGVATSAAPVNASALGGPADLEAANAIASSLPLLDTAPDPVATVKKK
jgi:hypothetical protein